MEAPSSLDPNQYRSPKYIELENEAAAGWRARHPSLPDEAVAAMARVTASRWGFDLAFGGASKAAKIARVLHNVDYKESLLQGVHAVVTSSSKTGKMLPVCQSSVPIDNVARTGWALFHVDEEGRSIPASDEEQQAAFRDVERASKPSIFCARCNHPLGIRLPNGPKGEVPPVVYVRGPRAEPGICNKLWWESLDGRSFRSCTHSLVHQTQAVLHALQFPDTDEHIASCPDQDLHALAGHIERDPEVQRCIREDWTYALGIAQLIRWKNTALMHNGDVILRLDAKHISALRARIPYDQGTTDPIYRKVNVPVDGIALLRGTRGRCPSCGHIQRLE